MQLLLLFLLSGLIAKKEISQDIAEEVKGSMQRLSNAQMLVFEADRYNSPAALLIKEDSIQRAVSLWPAFKKESTES